MKSTFLRQLCLLWFSCFTLTLSAAQPPLSPGAFTIKPAFIENKGQLTDVAGKPHPEVRYTAQLGSTGIFFAPDRISYVFNNPDAHDKTDMSATRIEVVFEGANRACRLSGEMLQPGVFNYYSSSIAGGGVTGAQSFARIVYKDLYPATDLVFTLNNGELKYDFVLHPGASVQALKLRYNGASKLGISKGQTLTAHAFLGTLRDHMPYSYNEAKGRKTKVRVSYALENNLLTFKAGSYDHGQKLVIDPQVVFFNAVGNASAGGSGTYDTHIGRSINANGSDVIIGGSTTSSAFLPGTVAYGPHTGYERGFVASFSPSGTLNWATTIDSYTSTVINEVGTTGPSTPIFACGTTGNGLPGGITYINGDAALPNVFHGGNSDAFIASFTSLGALSYTVYIGGSSDDAGTALTHGMHNYDKWAVGGYSYSTDIFGTPTYANPSRKVASHGGRDGFISHFIAAFPTMPLFAEYAFIGSSYDDEVTDIDYKFWGGISSPGVDKLIVTGITEGAAAGFTPAISSSLSPNNYAGDKDVFVMSVAYPTMGTASFGAFLGDDSYNEYMPHNSVSFESPGFPYVNTNVYLSLVTESPTLNAYTSGAYQPNISSGRDNYFMALNYQLNTPLYASYFQRSANDYNTGAMLPMGIRIDRVNNIYLFGSTGDPYFNTTEDITPGGKNVPGTPASNKLDMFIARFNADYSLGYSALVGSNITDYNSDLTLDECNTTVYMTGATYTGTTATNPVQAVNCKIDANPVLSLSSTSNVLPSTLSISSVLTNLSVTNVQWYFDGIAIDNPSGGGSYSFFANLPGEYYAEVSTSSGCVYQSQHVIFKTECEKKEEYFDLAEVIEAEIAMGHTEIELNELRFWLKRTVVIPSGYSLTMKNDLVVADPCTRIELASDIKAATFDHCAFTGCKRWEGILINSPGPGAVSPVVSFFYTGISNADVAIFSYANKASLSNYLGVNISQSNFNNNNHHVSYFQPPNYPIFLTGIGTGIYSMVNYNNMLRLSTDKPCEKYDQYFLAKLPDNTHITMSFARVLTFEHNFFYGEKNGLGDVWAFRGEVGVLSSRYNRFTGKYRSCYDLFNGFDEVIENETMHCSMYEFGIRSTGDPNGGNHGCRIISNDIINNASGMAGISVLSHFGEDVIQLNNIRGFTTGIEFFNDQVITAVPTSQAEISSNTVTGGTTGIAVSYIENPVNNFGSPNSGYSFIIQVQIKCNLLLQNDYGIAGYGYLADQLTVPGTPPEEDAGNTLANTVWNIIWGNNGTTAFSYRTPPAFAPNTSLSLTKTNVVLDGNNYGLFPYSNDFVSQTTYASTGQPIVASYCRLLGKAAAQKNGVDEKAAESNKLLVYPNPVSDKLTIALGKTDEADRVEIFDLTGRLLLTSDIASGTQTVTLASSNWEAGIYFVKVMKAGKVLHMQKVLKAN